MDRSHARSERRVVKRGDVVLIVAPGTLGKPRPAVIVQADELGEGTTTVIVCPMSSEVGAAQTLRPVVEPSVANGLRVRSQIMTDKVIALRRDRVRRVVGRLETSAVIACLQLMLHEFRHLVGEVHVHRGHDNLPCPQNNRARWQNLPSLPPRQSVGRSTITLQKRKVAVARNSSSLTPR